MRAEQILLLAVFTCRVAAQEPSTCYGTTSDGSLADGWKLPSSGPNFSTYSLVGSSIGRTYVHSDVHAVVVDAYSKLATSVPEKVFVFGETGRRNGGEFEPHKTHRNGLSVDFMVPVTNQARISVRLPTSVFNKWGYDLEFDLSGRHKDLQIDAEAMAEHIFQLYQAAERRGIRIGRVIFDPQLQPLLHNTSRWPFLRDNITFSEQPSWVRHDEHYHVDFDLTCESSAE